MSRQLTFEGKTFKPDALEKSLTSMPEIQLSRDDVENNMVDIDPHPATTTTLFDTIKEVAVYKQGTKYFMLGGRDVITKFLADSKNLQLKARLVSKQMLKRLDTISVPQVEQNNRARQVENAMMEADRQAEAESRQTYPAYGNNRFDRRPQRFGTR